MREDTSSSNRELRERLVWFSPIAKCERLVVFWCLGSSFPCALAAFSYDCRSGDDQCPA